MKKFLFLGAMSFALAACSEPPATTRTAALAPHQVVKKVVHTSDGRYAYQDNSGIWWWYYMSTINSGSSASTARVGGYYSVPVSTSSGSSSSGPVSLPSGGGWGKGVAPTAQEMKGAETEEVELEVVGEGEPAIETENEGVTEVTEATVEAPAGEATAGEAGAAAPAAGGEAAAGGGDAGGGGGDGGGGGGGD